MTKIIHTAPIKTRPVKIIHTAPIKTRPVKIVQSVQRKVCGCDCHGHHCCSNPGKKFTSSYDTRVIETVREEPVSRIVETREYKEAPVLITRTNDQVIRRVSRNITPSRIVRSRSRIRRVIDL